MKTEQKNAVEMLPEIVSNCQDINNVLTTAKIQNRVQTHHYLGLQGLIAEILTDNGAVFPKGIEATELRSLAIGASMFASEIIAEIERRFTAGSTRYPYQSVHTILCQFMKNVGKINLKNTEDKPRPCCKPRIKFYLVEE